MMILVIRVMRGILRILHFILARPPLVVFLSPFLLQSFSAQCAENNRYALVGFVGGIGVGMALGYAYAGVRVRAKNPHEPVYPEKPVPCSQWHGERQKWEGEQVRRQKKGGGGHHDS